MIKTKKCSRCQIKKFLNKQNFQFNGKIYSKKCKHCLEYARKWHMMQKHVRICCLVCHDGNQILANKFERHCETIKHKTNLKKPKINKPKLSISKNKNLKDRKPLFQSQNKYSNNWLNYYINDNDNKSIKCQGICCSFYQEENRPDGKFCKVENKFFCKLCSI